MARCSRCRESLASLSCFVSRPNTVEAAPKVGLFRLPYVSSCLAVAMHFHRFPFVVVSAATTCFETSGWRARKAALGFAGSLFYFRSLSTLARLPLAWLCLYHNNCSLRWLGLPRCTRPTLRRSVSWPTVLSIEDNMTSVDPCKTFTHRQRVGRTLCGGFSLTFTSPHNETPENLE